MIDREQSAASQSANDIVAEVVLLKSGQHHNAVLVLLGRQQGFTNFEHGIGSDDLGLAEVKIDFARPLHR